MVTRLTKSVAAMAILAASAFLYTAAAGIADDWAKMAGAMKGKVVYASPPTLKVLDLSTGQAKDVPSVTVAGSPGRSGRGKTPRPSWSPEGDRFLYRYNGKIYVCDPAGNKEELSNSKMKKGDETRWSWWKGDGGHWAVGPSTSGGVIRVNISKPSEVKTVYGGSNVKNWCEMTGTGKYVVYFDGSNVNVTSAGSSDKGKRISSGQSCRPCAAPDDRAAWLQNPHTKYHIHNAKTGASMGALKAPSGEEIYRMNWSNLPDYAAHMDGSESAQKRRMHVRKISNGAKAYIGIGWDPDLWAGDATSLGNAATIPNNYRLRSAAAHATMNNGYVLFDMSGRILQAGNSAGKDIPASGAFLMRTQNNEYSSVLKIKANKGK